MEKYVQVLKEKGFKITNQRMDVLEVLEENCLIFQITSIAILW